MLKILRKELLLTMVLGLAACSSPSMRKAGDVAITSMLARPVDVNALDGRSLVSYDVYAEGDLLHALFAATSDVPKKPYVGYIRSEDGGRHWSAPVEIGQYVAETMESSAGNEIQIAASGDTLLAIWQVTGEIPGMGPLQAIYSGDGGKRWALGVNPTGSDADQSHPDLIADSLGRFHLVWLDDRDENGYQGIHYARSDNAGRDWELAQTIDDSTCSCCWNRLLMDGEERVDALYRDMEPRDMALAQSEDSGRSWRRVGSVGEFGWKFDGCPHNGGALARAGETLQALVWTGLENKAGLYHLYSGDKGASWSKPQRMGGASLAFHSDIAAIDADHVLAIWDARGSTGSVVKISESFDGGRHWSASRPVSTPGRSAEFPRVIATAKGGLAMWVEKGAGGVKQWMSAIFQ